MHRQEKSDEKQKNMFPIRIESTSSFNLLHPNINMYILHTIKIKAKFFFICVMM